MIFLTQLFMNILTYASIFSFWCTVKVFFLKNEKLTKANPLKIGIPFMYNSEGVPLQSFFLGGYAFGIIKGGYLLKWRNFVKFLFWTMFFTKTYPIFLFLPYTING